MGFLRTAKNDQTAYMLIVRPTVVGAHGSKGPNPRCAAQHARQAKIIGQKQDISCQTARSDTDPTTRSMQ